MLNEQIANREQRCSDLRLLEQAFGSQGILALRIDASGPTIAGIANQLLQSTFGARFALRIVTQRSKVDGSLAEDCDVLVSDSQTDEVASLRNKSGGEKVWLDDALARAIAVFLREEKGQVFATFLSDEADGALDQDRKRSFTGMKRESLRLSGMVREIFISHDPDARNEADVVIDISAL